MGLTEDFNELDRRSRENLLSYYNPYPFQREFHCSRDSYGNLARQVALIAGNKTGKTYSGAMNVAIHATGLYPSWWDGIKFDRPVLCWAAGNTINNTRDIVQAELLGEPGNPDVFGCGAIPRHLIGRVTKYHGVPDALQSVLVRHVSGRNSKIMFKAFEQKKEAFMGKAVDVFWPDEELPMDIYEQGLRASLKTGGIIGLTFTPENGITDVVDMFLNNLGKGQNCIRATWDDAPHLTMDIREQILAGLPAHQREMRSKGIPVMGHGKVFPIRRESLSVDPFVIPDHWKWIAGLDFGWDHPTAWVSLAYDPLGDVIYVVDCYKRSNALPDVHAATISKKGGKWMPTAWPHDGLQSDKTSGKKLKDMYREYGLNMLFDKFSNPPEPGKGEGTGGNGVEAGIMELLTRMESGRFKVFSHLEEWWVEFEGYYRRRLPNGMSEIVKKKDDIMSATRYAAMSVRFSMSKGYEHKPYIPDVSTFNDAVVCY